MAGRVCVRKEGLSLRHYRHGLTRVHMPKRASKREEEHQPERARQGGLAGERRVERNGGLPVVVLVPASFGLVARHFQGWSPASPQLGSPAWGANSSLLCGSWHVAMPRGAGGALEKLNQS